MSKHHAPGFFIPAIVVKAAGSRGKVMPACVLTDRLVFTYNFKDGTDTLTLEEIKAAFGSDLTQVALPHLKKTNLIPIGNGFGFFVYIADIGEM